MKSLHQNTTSLQKKLLRLLLLTHWLLNSFITIGLIQGPPCSSSQSIKLPHWPAQPGTLPHWWKAFWRHYFHPKSTSQQRTTPISALQLPYQPAHPGALPHWWKAFWRHYFQPNAASPQRTTETQTSALQLPYQPAHPGALPHYQSVQIPIHVGAEPSEDIREHFCESISPEDLFPITTQKFLFSYMYQGDQFILTPLLVVQSLLKTSLSPKYYFSIKNYSEFCSSAIILTSASRRPTSLPQSLLKSLRSASLKASSPEALDFHFLVRRWLLTHRKPGLEGVSRFLDLLVEWQRWLPLPMLELLLLDSVKAKRRRLFSTCITINRSLKQHYLVK